MRIHVCIAHYLAGLGVGDPVVSTGLPLCVELGPGLLGSVFDGIQRPLDGIKLKSNKIYIPRGIQISPLDRTMLWDYNPMPNIKIGDLLSEGDVFGVVYENKLIKNHR